MKNFGLLPEKELDPRDYVLGAIGDNPPELTPDPFNFWKKYKPSPEFQRMSDGDTMSCVTFSCLNAIEYYFERLMETDKDVRTILESLGCIDASGNVNFSDRYTAIMSGTTRDGNSVSAVVESIRKDGVLGEKFLPSNPNMTFNEFHDKNKITPELKEQAKKILNYFDFKHAWLPTTQGSNNQNSQAVIEKGLRNTVLRVSVDGSSYERTDDGRIKGTPQDFEGKLYRYTHSVACYGGVKGSSFAINDNYNSQYLDFVWEYPLGNAKALWVVPKKKLKLVKTKSSPAVYLYSLILDEYYGIASSDKITGGDLLKTFCAGKYENAEIEVIDEIPASKIKGEIKQTNF